MPIKLNSSGGGSVTIDVPSTASTFTLTMPAKTANVVTTGDTGTVTQTMLGAGVAGNGPAFMAYLGSTQTVANSTFTKLAIDTEETNGDPNNCYDTTNYRFTPNVAGYYLIISQAAGITSLRTGIYTSIYKNGSAFKTAQNYGTAGSLDDWTVTSTAIIYFNGTSDYVETYIFVAGSNLTVSAGIGNTYFSGALLRAA